MDEEFLESCRKLFDTNETDNSTCAVQTILSDNEGDDISYFFPVNTSHDQKIDNSESLVIKRIQNQLALLTKFTTSEEIETKINDLLTKDILARSENSYKSTIERIERRLELQTTLTKDLQSEKSTSIRNNDNQQLSYFAIRSVSSILLILIKSAQKHDPCIVDEILTLTSELCDELPMKCFTSSNHRHLLKSLTPLISYIEQLLTSNDLNQARQVRIILLSFAIARGSFKDILSLLTEMIFDTVNTYRVGGILTQLSNGLRETIKQDENTLASKEISRSLDYLKFVGEYPDSESKDSNDKLLTGQLFASIILSHLELDDQTYSSKQFEQGAIGSSFSFEFHPNTFRSLSEIIERLAVPSDATKTQILTVCLRLFTTHLKFLDASRIDPLTYASNDQLTKWLDLLLKIIADENQKSTSIDASKALIYLINLPTWSFIQKLEFIHQYIANNRYPALIEQLYIEFSKEETIMSWIELLCTNSKDKVKALEILYSFIDKSTISTEKQFVRKILSSFHQLLTYRLTQSDTSVATSFFFIQYLTYLFQHPIKTELIDSILVYLSLMTKINETFDFKVIQPIFSTVLPLLSDFLLQQTNHDLTQLPFISWLLGKMTQYMITNCSLDALELKHKDKLNLLLFAGGCETPALEQSDYLSHLSQSNLANYTGFHLENQAEKAARDEAFLLSIYNNIGEGAQLISRIRAFAKNKQRLLQKSIEQQANELTAAVFAIFVKHYRRINLARYELTQADEMKPSLKLISIFEYASQVQTVLATVKAQNGDCETFAKQIKAKTYFLLTFVKENHMISIINEVLTSILDIPPKNKELIGFQRQVSRWSQAKKVIDLLRNLMEACIRFRKSILSKKNNSDIKIDYEHLLNRTIDQFLYEDFYKSNTPISIEDTNQLLDELKTCLYRQYERATTRLMSYRFAQKFIYKLCKSSDQPSVLIILRYYLPCLRNSGLEWSYLENISATNDQLKEEIRVNYHLIIKTILQSSLFQSHMIQKNIFYLLNFNYDSADMDHLLPERLLQSENLEKENSLDHKLTAFNWFRLFVLKLCENIQLELIQGVNNERLEHHRTLVFDTFILNEFRRLKNIDVDNRLIHNSLKNLSLGWFHQAIISQTFEIDLYINQYLVLLFRCIHFYEHVRRICATMEFTTELLDIYHRSKHNVTRLLVLKILRELLPHLSEIISSASMSFLEEMLVTIGNNFISSPIESEIVNELINIYRTILSSKSSCQSMALLTLHSAMETRELNKLTATFCVLGGYIQPYCLSSIVKVYNDEDFRLGLIIDISNTSSYTIQYYQTNQITSVDVNRIEQKIIVSPPDFQALLTTDEAAIHSILNILGYWIQSSAKSLNTLQLKRRSISVLTHMLTNQKIIELFIEKPYAANLIELAISNTLPTFPDLRLFNKQHLEQYCLSLDNCRQEKDWNIPEDDKNTSSDQCNPMIVKALSTSVLKYNGWKPYMSKDEIEFFKNGRSGNDDISIVPMPSTAADTTAVKPCGTKHQFNGRISPTGDNVHVGLPTFVTDQLRVGKGNWYFCVRLPKDGVQIGWATHKFNPRGNDGKGLGDDEYSWAYDGSRGLFLADGVFDKQFNDVRWKENDVCGCGIEIDGENTNIKYWLNGKLLGTAFKHQTKIPGSYTTCYLLPNETLMPFYPGVTLQFTDHPSTYCEFIFSPEDMQQCPLPDGYKPLLLPKVINTENSIVAYPFNAYLVGDQIDDYRYQSRTTKSTHFLRDFVSERHLQIDFLLNDQRQLVLTANSFGLPISVDKDLISFTISFDFQITAPLDSISLVSDTADVFSLKIPFFDKETRVVLVFYPREQQTKVYINRVCQTFETLFPNETCTFSLLPKTDATIRNIGIWKYALPEDHIQRLFTYGLFYVATDYQQIKEYRKRANTFSFEKKEFANESLIPFDQPFERMIWKSKMKHADSSEVNYFSTADPSVIEFFGNKTYLILEKPTDIWFHYTLILDVSIPKWPAKDKQISLVTLNDKIQIYVTSNGKLCLQYESTNNEGNSEVTPAEFFRMWIHVDKQTIKVYKNGSLEIDLSDEDDRYNATLDHFDIFREVNLTKSGTDENSLRIRCRSITFLNQGAAINEEMQTPDQSLESLIAPPLSVISPNLIAIGYKKRWIQSVIDEYKTTNVQRIDTILREERDKFVKLDLETEAKDYKRILLRITPEIDFSNVNINEQITTISQRILTEWTDDRNEPEIDSDDNEEEHPWFHRTIKELSIDESLTDWLRDRSTVLPEPDIMHQLYDINEQIARLKNQHKSVRYSHEGISQKTYYDLRLSCENALAIVYARHTIITMLETWANNSTALFPWGKFDDPSFIVALFRLMIRDEKFNRIQTIVLSILQNEFRQFKERRIDLQTKTPLIIQLRDEIVIQSLSFLFGASPSFENNSVESVLKLFIELFKSTPLLNDDQIDHLVSLLFPTPLIKILFDLFLIIHAHPTKVVILHFFTTLLQMSRIFHLKQSMQDFFIDLLITLSSDETYMKDDLMKTLRRALMDLVSVIFSKQQSLRFSDLPADIRDFYTVIDVIHVLMDSAKRTQLPEIFFIQSRDLLGNVHQLDRDDFDRCNKFFDAKSDQQLIHAMNKSLLQNSSFGEFIRNLPTESDPSASFYQKYLILSHIPADCLSIRAKFLYQLNKLIEKILSLVDLSLSPGQSVLSDQIRTVKSYLLTTTKLELLRECLEKTETDYNYDSLDVQFDTVEGSVTSENTDNTMFHQAYRQLHTDAQTIFRRPNEQLWQAQYVGMHSTDAGGPYRDSITCICSDICSTRVPLFVLCPNGRTNSGLNRDCWIPKSFPPNKSISTKFQKQYRFVGQLMGFAIRKKHYLNLKFAPIVWKQLLKEPITIDDIQAIDIQSFTMIDEMEKNIEQAKSVDSDNQMDYVFDNFLSELRFNAVSSTGEIFELIPGGMDIAITTKNFEQYCACYRSYRLTEFNRQIEYIRQGLASVVPCYYLSLFTAAELEKIVCGEGEIDIQLLKRNTKYERDYKPDSPVIERFWTVLKDRFTEEQRRLFLIFVWGRSILPTRDEDFNTMFCIDMYDADNEEIDKILPRSHTCSFTIDLPKYSTVDIMYERLNYAMTYCSSIDNDGTMIEASETNNFREDSSDGDE
ncbi:unnamed protein product [Adineta ricciae]|uniref:B30.2/SPRY domain-containing protein n=1 Tax=Adineta ricciae TaxID=249248 RepID=A0A814IU95_ADIRI|nr:unnamed protein product [Adineta ricciae]CAF1026348.1 unnamed protein product [Adineta ricciae]